MKLLVTGGAGFIGSNFVKYWLGKNKQDEIVVLDSLTYAGRRENLRELEKNDNFEFVKGDIVDEDLVKKLVGKVDTVVHFAAESHVDRSIMGPGVVLETNIWGTFALLEAVRDNLEVHFHHVSTDEVYGELERDSSEKFSEKTAYDPHSPYSASKAASDHLVRAYRDTYGIKMTLTNCSNNYGPYQHVEKLIPLVITNVLEGKRIPVYGDGGQIRDWLYVEDHCRGIETVIKEGKIGETYMIGGMKKQVTNLQVVKIILQIMEKDEERFIDFVKDRPGHDQKYAVDWSKINEELGWEPRMSLKEGLEETIKWYRQNEDWWRKVKGVEFKKYYQRQYNKDNE